MDFRTTFCYNAEGRWQNETSYNADNSLQHQADQVYNANGYLRTIYYLPEGEPDDRTEERFSAAGLRLEEKGLTLSGETEYRVTYRYTGTGC